MTNYTKERLNEIAQLHGPFIIESRFGDTYIGYLFIIDGMYQIFPLNINTEVIAYIHKSSIKRIINFNGYVQPKTKNTKKYRMLNLFELNELIDKAGYEFC